MRQETKHHRTHAHLYPARPPPWMPPSPAAAPYAAVPAAHLGDCAMHIRLTTIRLKCVCRHDRHCRRVHVVAQINLWRAVDTQACCCLGCYQASERRHASDGRRHRPAGRVQDVCCRSFQPMTGVHGLVVASPVCYDHMCSVHVGCIPAGHTSRAPARLLKATSKHCGDYNSEVAIRSGAFVDLPCHRYATYKSSFGKQFTFSSKAPLLVLHVICTRCNKPTLNHSARLRLHRTTTPAHMRAQLPQSPAQGMSFVRMFSLA